jgi:Flp pilus assembly protein TadD
MLQRPVEAEGTFKAAQEIARSQGVRPRLWRICIDLGKLYQAQGKSAEAEQAFMTARTMIEELSANVVDGQLHEQFLGRAMAMLGG